MLQQELDRVVRVRGIVHILRPLLVIDVRTHLDEFALAHPPSAHVLVHEDVSALLEFL